MLPVRTFLVCRYANPLMLLMYRYSDLLPTHFCCDCCAPPFFCGLRCRLTLCGGVLCVVLRCRQATVMSYRIKISSIDIRVRKHRVLLRVPKGLKMGSVSIVDGD